MSSTTMPTSDPLVFVRYLDVLLVILAAPFVILMGAPVLGYCGGGAWIATRVLGVAVERVAKGRPAKRRSASNFAALMGRAGCSELPSSWSASPEIGKTVSWRRCSRSSRSRSILATSLALPRPERNTPSP
jgi:hypothetical protein